MADETASRAARAKIPLVDAQSLPVAPQRDPRKKKGGPA